MYYAGGDKSLHQPIKPDLKKKRKKKRKKTSRRKNPIIILFGFDLSLPEMKVDLLPRSAADKSIIMMYNHNQKQIRREPGGAHKVRATFHLGTRLT